MYVNRAHKILFGAGLAAISYPLAAHFASKHLFRHEEDKKFLTAFFVFGGMVVQALQNAGVHYEKEITKTIPVHENLRIEEAEIKRPKMPYSLFTHWGPSITEPQTYLIRNNSIFGEVFNLSRKGELRHALSSLKRFESEETLNSIRDFMESGKPIGIYIPLEEKVDDTISNPLDNSRYNYK